MRAYIEVDQGQALKWTPFALLEKWDIDQVNWVRSRTGIEHPNGAIMQSYVEPYDRGFSVGNMIMNTGLNKMSSLITGSGGQALNSTAVRLGVGDSTTAVTAADTDLGTNRYYRVMDATYPQFSNGVMTFKASFTTSEALFAWQCWGLDSGTPTVTSSSTVNTLFNRKLHSQGTKGAEVWAFTVTVTITST